MSSTTIHFPDQILTEIDQAAKGHNISRNKFVIKACKAAVACEQGEWPEDFFNLHLAEEDEKLLRETASEMEIIIFQNRRNRGASAL